MGFLSFYHHYLSSSFPYIVAGRRMMESYYDTMEALYVWDMGLLLVRFKLCMSGIWAYCWQALSFVCLGYGPIAGTL